MRTLIVQTGCENNIASFWIDTTNDKFFVTYNYASSVYEFDEYTDMARRLQIELNNGHKFVSILRQ